MNFEEVKKMDIIVVFNPDYKTEYDENGIYDTEIGSHIVALFNKKPNNFLAFIPLKVSGRTYAERKDDLQNKAIEWSYASGVGAWSYGELATIQEFFEINGRRYGLLNEFRENAII